MNDVFSRIGEYTEVISNGVGSTSGSNEKKKRCLAACENQVGQKVTAPYKITSEENFARKFYLKNT